MLLGRLRLILLIYFISIVEEGVKISININFNSRISIKVLKYINFIKGSTYNFYLLGGL